MTTADVARELGVSTGFVRGEIHAGRLVAKVSNRDGLRCVYRLTRAQVDAYLSKYWNGVPRDTDSAQRSPSAPTN